MRHVERQLQKFYQHQGLTGNHLRKALQYDRKAIRRAQVAQDGRVTRINYPLSCLFTWGISPEGHEYWSVRDLSV